MSLNKIQKATIDNHVDVGALTDVVRGLLGQGVPWTILERELKALYVRLGDAGREADQDAVADVVDSLVGWASPSALL